MQEILWNKNIEDLDNSGYINFNESITDALIKCFYNDILKGNEKKLLSLVFSENPKQEDLDELLKDWDIEAKGGAKSLLLLYIQKLYPEFNFNHFEEPRMNGLLKYFRFKNLNTIAHFSKIGKALNAQGIIPMILKGGAMKYLRPELPRVMGDVDILVPEDVFMKSAEIATSIGYEYDEVFVHAIDIHKKGTEEGVMDIHRYINIETGADKELLEGLYKRATKVNAFGVDVLFPSTEDMMFILLVNLAKNLRDKTSQAGLLFTLFDSKYLLESKPDFDWNIVKENAKKTKSEVFMNFSIKFIKYISKNILPDEIQNDVMFEKETNLYSNEVMYRRFYFEPLREVARNLKIIDVIKNPKLFFKYITLKPKYLYIKSFRKHPKLISLFINYMVKNNKGTYDEN